MTAQWSLAKDILYHRRLSATPRNSGNLVCPLVNEPPYLSVHSRLILKDEEYAIHFLQKLTTDPLLGPVVRELHALSNLSRETGIHDFGCYQTILDVILKGSLPFIHTLGLHLGDEWYYDDQFNPVNEFDQPGKEFWSQIKGKCPRIKALILDGLRDDPDEPWIEYSGLFHVSVCIKYTSECNQISDVCCRILPICRSIFMIHGYTLQPSASQKIFQYISSLVPSLHTIDLQPSCLEFKSTSSISELNFLACDPCLLEHSMGSIHRKRWPSGNSIPPSNTSILPLISCGETNIGLCQYFLINFSQTYCTLEYVVSRSGIKCRKF